MFSISPKNLTKNLPSVVLPPRIKSSYLGFLRIVFTFLSSTLYASAFLSSNLKAITLSLFIELYAFSCCSESSTLSKSIKLVGISKVVNPGLSSLST